MKSDLLKLFGQKVRAKRLEMGASQEDLAELAGVHRTYVGMIERAEKNITLLNIQKFADALGVKIEDLLATENNGKRRTQK